MIVTLALIGIGLWVVWHMASISLRLGGWLLIGLALVESETPATSTWGTGLLLTAGAAAWIAGHVVFVIRHGYWRSDVLEWLADRRATVTRQPKRRSPEAGDRVPARHGHHHRSYRPRG